MTFSPITRHFSQCIRTKLWRLAVPKNPRLYVPIRTGSTLEPRFQWSTIHKFLQNEAGHYYRGVAHVSGYRCQHVQ